MNTLCKTCRHVDLLGHHKCYEDGEPVRVRQTTPAVHRLDMLDHYGLTPARANVLIKTSNKPFDSAVPHWRRGILPINRPIILGHDYYGVSVAQLLNHGFKVHYTPPYGK